MKQPFAKCQLLINQPAAGAWNMAVDELLLDAVATSGTPTLRFYQWERPTLSLGYFQHVADRTKHPASLSADMVRRLSGGGAILHDRELTYSLFLPKTYPLARNPQSLYNTVHQTIAGVLNALLVDAQSPWQATLCEHPAALEPQDEPFLCFQRRTQGDILLSQKDAVPNSPEHKVVGSAQRRRHGVVLQHGSILGRRSKLAAELAGISDMTQLKTIMTEMSLQLRKQLAKNLCFDLEDYQWTEQFAAQAQQLQQTKYQAASWTERR